MSKMRMPEMSVVRFEENDVICASVITVSNLNDNKTNMRITRYGVTILNNNHSQGYDSSLEEDGYGPNPEFVWDTTNYNFFTLSTLLQDDDAEAPIANVDGDYEWRGGRFIKIQ